MLDKINGESELQKYIIYYLAIQEPPFINYKMMAPILIKFNFEGYKKQILFINSCILVSEPIQIVNKLIN